MKCFKEFLMPFIVKMINVKDTFAFGQWKSEVSAVFSKRRVV